MKGWIYIVVLIGTVNDFGSVEGKTWKEDLTLTASEKKTLDKFKELMKDRLPPHKYMHSEIFLLRWLRARHFNINDAETMLMNHLKWRQEKSMDTIFQEDWTDYDREYPYYVDSKVGRDKEGKPVLYLNAKNWDLRQAVISGRRERFERFVDKGLEEACSYVRDLSLTQKNVTQGYLILNAEGFSLVQHGCLQCIPTFLRIIYNYEAHHPGCADKIIVVNIPQAAQPILETARLALHPETNKILELYGTNKKKWQMALRKYFEEDHLPPELGGTKKFHEDDDD